MKLRGKVALITGSSGGMGRATALEFAREGADSLTIQYNTSRPRALAVAKAVEGLGTKAKVLRADLAKKAEAAALVEGTVEAFGHLDLLVCLAGYPFKRDDWFTPFGDLTPLQLQAPLSADLLGTVYTCQAALPYIVERKGRIVLTASTPALTGDTVGISYLMAKAGILALTKSLALLLGPRGVQVNAIAPGSIATKAMGALSRGEEGELKEASALKRLGTPEEIARKVVFLASTDSDFLTGQTLVADGGYALL